MLQCSLPRLELDQTSYAHHEARQRPHLSCHAHDWRALPSPLGGNTFLPRLEGELTRLIFLRFLRLDQWYFGDRLCEGRLANRHPTAQVASARKVSTAVGPIGLKRSHVARWFANHTESSTNAHYHVSSVSMMAFTPGGAQRTTRKPSLKRATLSGMWSGGWRLTLSA